MGLRTGWNLSLPKNWELACCTSQALAHCHSRSIRDLLSTFRSFDKLGFFEGLVLRDHINQNESISKGFEQWMKPNPTSSAFWISHAGWALFCVIFMGIPFLLSFFSIYRDNGIRLNRRKLCLECSWNITTWEIWNVLNSWWNRNQPSPPPCFCVVFLPRDYSLFRLPTLPLSFPFFLPLHFPPSAARGILPFPPHSVISSHPSLPHVHCYPCEKRKTTPHLSAFFILLMIAPILAFVLISHSTLLEMESHSSFSITTPQSARIVLITNSLAVPSLLSSFSIAVFFLLCFFRLLFSHVRSLTLLFLRDLSLVKPIREPSEMGKPGDIPLRIRLITSEISVNFAGNGINHAFRTRKQG